MSFRKSTFIALAIVFTTSVTSGAEAVWPKNSASELSTFFILQRYRLYADHCSVQTPQLQQKFASLMDNLDSRIHDISRGLLASDVFKGMKDKPVPADIVFALKDMLDDAEHNFERQEAAIICPKTLQSLGEMDDESLKVGLSEILLSVQNMTQNLEKGSAR